MAQVNIRIDDDLKTCADGIFNELGLNMTTAFTMFIRFYSAEKMSRLRKSIRKAEKGKLTAHGLIDE